MKFIKKTTAAVTISLVAFAAGGFFLGVKAQNLLPPQIIEIFNLLGKEGAGAAGFLTSRIQLALVIALGAVVLVAVVYAILAAFKYISSQGDAGKIEEAQKAIKAYPSVGIMIDLDAYIEEVPYPEQVSARTFMKEATEDFNVICEAILSEEGHP